MTDIDRNWLQVEQQLEANSEPRPVAFVWEDTRWEINSVGRTWDADGDQTYGEIADGVDLYPDVFVGRASVCDADHVSAFVAKVIAYERTPPAGEQLDMLMAAEVLWTDPFTDSGIALNLIDREYVPPRFDPITKLYETLGNESVASVTAALNDGKGLFLQSAAAATPERPPPEKNVLNLM